MNTTDRIRVEWFWAVVLSVIALFSGIFIGVAITDARVSECQAQGNSAINAVRDHCVERINRIVGAFK